MQFLKKIFVDILPSVVATIVGAYIVHHYVIPLATPKTTPAAVAPAEAKVAPEIIAPAEKPLVEKPSFVKGVAEKAAIEKTAEKASEKSDAAPDSKKRHNAARTKPAASEQTASIPESPAVDERRDANGLARAAIERLRPAAEAPRVDTPRVEAPRVDAPRVEAARTESARTVATAPSQQTLPPLAPAVTLAPSSEVFNSGTGAIVAPARPGATRSADATRMQPPADIPAAPPLELHDDIPTTTGGRAAAVADDVVSAAKSVFHAVLPLK